jgi:hypothetical protein
MSEDKKKKDFTLEINKLNEIWKKTQSKLATDADRHALIKESVILLKTIEASKNEAELEKYLKWQRARKLITKSNEYKLNKIEADRLATSCQMVTRMNASGMHILPGQDCKFDTFYDEDRESQMFTIYPVREIPPESQLTELINQRIQKGHHVPESDFPETKYVTHRFTLRESEFVKYFREL